VLAQDEGRVQEAIERFSAAVRHDTAFGDAHFTLAEALRRTGRAEAALPHYERVLQLNDAASHADSATPWRSFNLGGLPLRLSG
jgi:tetratricopeptide (TPR) repeat protein